ncbi:hypothetical protein Lesp02_66410 [Lentzea sp. NBRC 105346]|nr:hypothetical protein Lesp02_66410 [Lentzea sp. NBRC 105346]
MASVSHRVNDEPGRTRRFRSSDSSSPSASSPSETSGSWESLDAPSGSSGSSGRLPTAKTKKKQPFWREVLVIAVVALALTTVIQTFIAKVFVIPSGSMETTLHGCYGCVNDKVLVDKVTFLFRDPQPGDVIVFRGPPNWTGGQEPPNFFVGTAQDIGSIVGLSEPSGTDFIKRVIAVGGQTVECCDDKGRVLVDGKPLDEPYLNLAGGQQQQPFEKVTVPAGRLWVMGDNRNNSADSRKHGDPTPADGAIPIDNVVGKARVIVMPFSRWQTITDHNPQGR